MTYLVIIYERPESIDYTGPKKWRVAKCKFEKICEPAVVMIQFGDAVYRMDDKKVFTIEHYTTKETTHSILVCEAHKLKQPT